MGQDMRYLLAILVFLFMCGVVDTYVENNVLVEIDREHNQICFSYHTSQGVTRECEEWKKK